MDYENKHHDNINKTKKLSDKIKLYSDQNGKSFYTQQSINLDLLIEDSNAYEIDHIIPISISFDNSYNNKVLATHNENHNEDGKGQLTPYLAFQKNIFPNRSYEQYLAYVKSLKINRKKYYYATYQGDISKYENMKEFINRNLVDTSYANRLVLSTLMDYFKDNDIQTKVYTIKGIATAAFRKRLKLKKDREDFSHHAIDALIIASIKKLDLYNKILMDFSITGKDVNYNKETSEIIDNLDDKNLLNEKYINFLENLVNTKVTKFSHQIDTKPNRSISDQTICSTRNYDGKDYVIRKIKNIYDKKDSIGNKPTKIANYIINGKKEKFLMYKYDPKTFEKIEKIVLDYYHDFKDNSEKIVVNDKGLVLFKENPLFYFHKQTKEYITKYSKKNKGPIITQMQYVESKLGSHIDITSKYKTNKDKKVVLLQLSPYRTDFYLDDGIYKFVTIRYKDIRYEKKEKEYEIDKAWYDEQKKIKKISENAIFCFSMHHNEYIKIIDKEHCNLYKFTATDDDKANGILVKSIDKIDKEPIRIRINSSTKSLSKYSCDILGNIRKITDSKLKLRFK